MTIAASAKSRRLARRAARAADASSARPRSARLRVIGAAGRRRACRRCIASAGASPPARARGARARSRAVDDRRALDRRSAALAHAEADVGGGRGVGVLRGWVPREAGHARARRDHRVAARSGAATRASRLAALDALSELPRDLVQPIRRTSAHAGTGGRSRRSTIRVAAREWVAAHGARRRSPSCTTLVVGCASASSGESSARRQPGMAAWRAAPRTRRWPGAAAAWRSTTCARRSTRPHGAAAARLPGRRRPRRRRQLPRAAGARLGRLARRTTGGAIAWLAPPPRQSSHRTRAQRAQRGGEAPPREVGGVYLDRPLPLTLRPLTVLLRRRRLLRTPTDCPSTRISTRVVAGGKPLGGLDVELGRRGFDGETRPS